jgi:hypothetical protein
MRPTLSSSSLRSNEKSDDLAFLIVHENVRLGTSQYDRRVRGLPECRRKAFRTIRTVPGPGCVRRQSEIADDGRRGLKPSAVIAATNMMERMKHT